jgi:hypothetical protein
MQSWGIAGNLPLWGDPTRKRCGLSRLSVVERLNKVSLSGIQLLKTCTVRDLSIVKEPEAVQHFWPFFPLFAHRNGSTISQKTSLLRNYPVQMGKRRTIG